VLQGDVQKLRLGVVHQPGFQVAVQFVGIEVVHLRPIAKTGVFGPFRAAHHLQQLPPLASFWRTHEDVAVLAAENAVGIGEV
jgi:hypothetical protein